MDHSFEEIRAAALDLLAGRETADHNLTQYQNLLTAVADLFGRRERTSQGRDYQGGGIFGASLSTNDLELFLEVFWTLFREGIITLGLNDANREFPFFRITEVMRPARARRQLKSISRIFVVAARGLRSPKVLEI
jgi:hypothetical protein